MAAGSEGDGKGTGEDGVSESEWAWVGQEASQGSSALPQLHFNSLRGQQYAIASLGLLTFMLVISIVLCLAPLTPAAAPVHQLDVRQTVAVVFSALLAIVVAVCWLQQRIWAKNMPLLEQVSQTFRPQATILRFLHELLVTFSDAFNSPAPTIQPRALERIGLSQQNGQLVPLINQVLRQIQTTVSELSTSELARLALQRNQSAVEMITKYLQRQPQVVGEQLWRSVLVEKAQRGVEGLMAESLYVGSDSPLAALLVQALQARDTAIVRQLLHEEEIRRAYAASIREVCDLTLAGNNAVRVPQYPGMAQELGDLAAVAESVNNLLDREAWKSQFLARVRQAIQATVEGSGSGARELETALQLAYPGLHTDPLISLVADLQMVLARLEQSDQSRRGEQKDSD